MSCLVRKTSEGETHAGGGLVSEGHSLAQEAAALQVQHPGLGPSNPGPCSDVARPVPKPSPFDVQTKRAGRVPPGIGAFQRVYLGAVVLCAHGGGRGGRVIPMKGPIESVGAGQRR